MKITAKALREKGACLKQVSLFVSEWPEGGEVTEAGLLRAAKIGLDMGWFARHFLPSPLWAEYERQDAPLWAEYDRQDASLLAEYLRQRAPILAEYKRQNAALILAEYDRQSAALWAEYKRQNAPILAEYKRQSAALIWGILKNM
mgnify:CR=1 FL=1